MRICHVISGDLWAGAAVQAYHTVVDLHSRRDVDVLAAVLNKGALADRLSAGGTNSRLFNEKRLSAIALVRQLAQLVTEWVPQILHVHAYKEHILATAARAVAGRRDIPIVRTFHGKRQVPPDLSALQRLKTKGIGYFERLLLRRAVLIAVSKELETYLRQAYPASKVELIVNGIPLPVVPMDRSAARARWRVPEGAFWVGSVARLEPVKNVSCLIRAAALLSHTLPGLRVSIFGTGSQHAALQALISALGAQPVITLHGFNDEMPATTAALDCFVLTSWHEGLPMSLLEAMALGVPPVCSRVGGMSELITPAVTGLLFEADDHAELAVCLRRISDASDEAARMGAAARTLVRESYSIELTNAALLRLYESVIAEGARR